MPTMNATTMTAQCTRRSPNSVMRVVAMRVAPPDSAIILPSMVPSATTIAMNPKTPPTPSSNAFTTPLNGIPAAVPRPRETAINAMKGCSLKRAINTISATTGAAQTTLQLRWELLGDSIANDRGASRAAFTLTNRGAKPLPSGGWALYFSALHSPQPGSVGGGFSSEDRAGDLHRLVPAA